MKKLRGTPPYFSFQSETLNTGRRMMFERNYMDGALSRRADRDQILQAVRRKSRVCLERAFSGQRPAKSPGCLARF